MRWHIDYFLNDEQARIKKIFLYPAAPGQECRQNQKIAAIRGAQFIRRKFGASDCRFRLPQSSYFLSQRLPAKNKWNRTPLWIERQRIKSSLKDRLYDTLSGDALLEFLN